MSLEAASSATRNSILDPVPTSTLRCAAITQKCLQIVKFVLFTLLVLAIPYALVFLLPSLTTTPHIILALCAIALTLFVGGKILGAIQGKINNRAALIQQERVIVKTVGTEGPLPTEFNGKGTILTEEQKKRLAYYFNDAREQFTELCKAEVAKNFELKKTEGELLAEQDLIKRNTIQAKMGAIVRTILLIQQEQVIHYCREKYCLQILEKPTETRQFDEIYQFNKLSVDQILAEKINSKTKDEWALSTAHFLGVPIFLFDTANKTASTFCAFTAESEYKKRYDETSALAKTEAENPAKEKPSAA